MAADFYKEWLGIPEGPRPPDHYTLLRLVQFNDDSAKVRANYKKLNAHVRKYATGKYSLQSQELLNELAKAMLCLTDVERKREYDESQGREFEEVKSQTGHKLLQNVLLDQGHISKSQVKDAENFAEGRGLSMRDAVVQMKLTDSETAAQALATELGYSYIDLSDVLPDDSILDQCPRSLVKHHSFIPLFVDNDYLLIACAEQPDHDLEDELRLRYGLPMRVVVATPRAINQNISKYYAPGMRDEAVVPQKSTKRSVKAKTKAKAKSKRPAAKRQESQKAFSQLSEGEKQQRKQMGMLMMMWGGLIGPILLDEFILKPYLIPQALQFSYVPSLATLVMMPSVIWYVLKVYWK